MLPLWAGGPGPGLCDCRRSSQPVIASVAPGVSREFTLQTEKGLRWRDVMGMIDFAKAVHGRCSSGRWGAARGDVGSRAELNLPFVVETLTSTRSDEVSHDH